MTSDLPSQQGTPQRENTVVVPGNKPHPPTGVPTVLENRVQVLEDHNTRLEGCISQLKQITSNKGPPHSQSSTNGSPAHLTPRGSPYVRPERKYHYVTMTTPNPANKTNASQYHATASTPQPAVSMATGAPAHSNYVPVSPAHQRLQPPALVRNKYRNQVTTTLL